MCILYVYINIYMYIYIYISPLVKKRKNLCPFLPFLRYGHRYKGLAISFRLQKDSFNSVIKLAQGDHIRVLSWSCKAQRVPE